MDALDLGRTSHSCSHLINPLILRLTRLDLSSLVAYIYKSVKARQVAYEYIPSNQRTTNNNNSTLLTVPGAGKVHGNTYPFGL
jgi:hypothetical protein